MNDNDIYDYLFGGGEDSVTPTYADVPTFDASSLADIYGNTDTNFLSNLFSNAGSSISNLFSDTDLSKYFDTATPGAESYFTKDISPDLGITGNRVYYDDGSFSVVDPETGRILGGVDTENKGFTVDESGKATYMDTGEGLGGTPEKTFGGNLADKADVDALLKYNAAIAQGGYPVQNKDGSVTVKDTNGKNLFTVGNDGKIVPGGTGEPGGKTGGGGDGKGKISNNAALLAALLGGLLGLAGQPKTGGARGYMAGAGAGGAKPLTATRTALPVSGAPGAGGKRFLSDVTYAADGGLMSLYDMNTPVAMMASGGIADDSDYLNMGRGLSVGDLRRADYLVRSGVAPSDASVYYGQVPEGMAHGGISDLGSYSDGGRMLKGAGDGMSDSIPATIGGKKPARLAEGEFVVPADVVSHLGNGSTDAGADVLYDMMNKVRKARTGTQKQGKQINPSKYVPR